MVARILIIVAAFLVGCVAATAILTIAYMVGGIIWTDLPISSLWDLSMVIRAMRLVAPSMFVFVVAFTFIPTLLIAVVAEIYRLRSIMFYAIASGIVGIVCNLGLALGLYLIWPTGLPRTGAIFVPNYSSAVMVAAGLVAGVVYWAIAGRKAGNWRGSVTARSATLPKIS